MGGGHDRPDLAAPCFQDLVKLGRRVPEGPGPILPFAPVFLQVGELQRSILEILDQLEIAGLNFPAGVRTPPTG